MDEDWGIGEQVFYGPKGLVRLLQLGQRKFGGSEAGDQCHLTAEMPNEADLKISEPQKLLQLLMFGRSRTLSHSLNL